MAAQTIVIDIVANFVNKTASGMNSAKQSVDRFNQSVDKSNRMLDKLDGKSARPKVSLVDRASSTLEKVDKGLKSIGGKTVRAGVKILDYATRPLQAIKNTLFSIKGLVAAVTTGLALNKLIAEPISIADSYSRAKIGFSNLLGDSAGQKMMDDLDEFAKKTPFNTSGVIQNAQMMMAMGWDAEDILTDMETIGNAAAATGKGTQGLEAIVRALAQIKTKGKLSSEELNQLSEQGIAAKAMLAEQLGYGTGDKGIAKMSKDLEKGLIGSDKAIQALLQGMKQFDGMMDKTANETVEGLKSQIEDAFEINVLRRWGQGLQDGAKRGLGSVLELLDESEDSLEKLGDTVYEIGKELSNWAADKLESTIDKILEITEREDFQNASLFGKAKILWDEVIAQPFSEWWDAKGRPFMAEKMGQLGEGLGSGLTKGLQALLGIDVIGATGEAATIGGSFASGFAKGFESKKVWEAIVDAAGRAFKAGFTSLFTGSWLERIIVGVMGLKITSGILSSITKVQTLWAGTGEVAGTGALTLSGMGLKGMLGATGNAMVGGSGILGSLASLGYKATGFTPTAGMYFGNMAGAMSGGTAALAGLGTAAGIAGGVAGAVNAIGDLTRTINATSKNDKTLYGTRAATKGGMVALGAGIGTLIAPGLGTALGAGLGGIATFLAGNKLADAISGVSKSTEQLNQEAEELAEKRMDKRFGEITLSAEQLAKRVQTTSGEKTINRVEKFNQSMSDLEAVQKSVTDYADDLAYTHERIMGKETLSESDVQAYKESLEGYAAATKELLGANKTSTTNAYKLLYGDDTKGLQSATKSMNSMYTKLEKELAERSNKLNEVIADAFSDGKITIDEEKKINEIVKQIEEIQAKIDERLRQKEQEKSKATYDLISDKYSDTDLSVESYKALISELDAQREIDDKAYDDARIEATADVNMQLKLGEIDESEANKKLAEIEKKWREGKAIALQKSVEISLNVLKTNYSSEFEGIEKKLSSGELFSNSNLLTLQGSTRDKVAEARTVQQGDKIYKWDKDSEIEFKAMKDSFLKGAGIDKAAQKEMKELYESLKPQEADLQELKRSYEEAGEKVPKWIEDSLADIANIKLMSGDMDSFYKIVGEQLATEDKEYAQELLEKAGEDLPKALKEGLEKGLKSLESETIEYKTNLKVTADEKDIDTSGLDKTTQDVIDKLQEKGVLTITKDGEVKIKTKDGKIDTSDLDEKTKAALAKLEEEGIIKISKDGHVTVNASVDTSGAKTKTETETKGALGKDQSVNKTAKVKVDSQTSGEGEAANKSKAEVKSALDQRFGTSISENGRVQVNSVTISGAATAIANAWSTFKTWVKEKFSIGVSVTSNVRVNQRMGTTDNSKTGKVPKANGGYVDKAIHAIVGEAGPEMIIPLSANRRNRGKYLWERAGKAMGLYESSKDGVIMNANGGLYGTGASRLPSLSFGNTSGQNTEGTQRTGGNGTVSVNVGGVHITIQSSGQGVQQDISQNADDIAGQIADILQKAFQNMPVTV